ncbi:pyrroloquinoline quinone biosynthesis protein PqqB [Streptomyces sp. WAC 01529]|uniref:pyrroloquinoline quinone biosynthesis protein PqqB n=1 Tax=Streptomyces sp. WAC 01529 TaxID=2203205 RepID=UPI000F6BBCDC|nr:MBL fold metallo-hydrolase [Streptomyces sp. WAC 01529]AZM56708.1 pyrroloquinoline quinone biosynthesis protein PqqB [Streptomyces sp. WAC 01529]
MLLQVLGTAAGGGLPQWNCACPGCTGARAHPARRRRHAALAVRTGEDRWYLVNATPDLGDQIEATPALHPGARSDVGSDIRHTPLAGVVLTDAELDHTLGLARLREARDGVDVVATPPVRDAVREGLRLDALLEPYTAVRWRELPVDRGPSPAVDRGSPPTLAPGPSPTVTPGLPLGEDAAGIHVVAVPVSAKRPRYAAGTGPDTDTWSVALRLTEPATGRTALYAPALAVWSDAFEAAARAADCVFVDGTFWDDDEPVRAGFTTRTATAMGHLPITGPTGTAHRLTGLPGRCLYTHLNNTNPLGDPHAEQHKSLAEWGLEAATDGMVIEL